MKVCVKLCCISLALLALAACGNSKSSGGETRAAGTGTEKVYNFALVINGPINDGDWNENAWRGLEKVKAEYGDRVKINYSENVAQADYEDTFYGYAKDGYDLVIANGFEFSNAVFRVCDEFPNTNFAIVNGLEYRKNVCSLEFDNVEFGYIAGAAMGLLAKQRSTNTAFICAEAIPSYKNFYIGMQAGVQAVSPGTKTMDYYTGDWADVTKGSEMAVTAISSGYGVVIPWIGAVNHAIYTVCQERNVPFVNTSFGIDMAAYEDLFIITLLQQNSDLIAAGCKALIEGNFPANGALTGNLANGLNEIGEFGKILNADIRAQLNTIFGDLRSGKISLPQKVSG
jgi:basic membrane protein A